MTRRVFNSLLLALAMATPACHAADKATAQRALMEGRVDEAAAILQPIIAANGRDALAHLLMCRVAFAQEQIDAAVAECEAAIANGGANDSDTLDWMGRAYGRKADHAGPFTGMRLAGKVRAAFERAVALDPANAAATNDLSEYYVGAPGVVGGGTDKAMALADRVQAKLPQSAHRIRALVAEKKKDAGTAEREFRAAAEAPGKNNGWVDLADFYRRQNKPAEAIAALNKAVASATAHDAALVDVASILNDLHREPKMAEAALRSYLASSAKSDAAPAFKAHYQLGQLRQQAGDKAGARSEYQAGLALASKYEPARKALQSI